MKKILLSILLLLIVPVLGGLGYIKWALPKVDAAPALTIDKTEERVQRGEYLATSVAVCMDCHSTRDWNQYSGPIMPGTLGKGGKRFDENAGFPGVIYSRNITPAHLGTWTDGEIYRAITTGVSKNGKALFPVMPYAYYRSMDPEDVYDIIAYLRTLPSLENETAEGPAPADTLLYGAYMTNMAGCMECHTPEKRGQIIESESYAGGREFILPGGTIVRPSNISPDLKTGIGGWSRDMFIQRLRPLSSHLLPGIPMPR